jgi:phenylacetate-CoA ligase
MTMRNVLQRVASPLKRAGFGEQWVRRNPLYHRPAARLLKRLSGASLDARRDWTRERLARVLRDAGRTGYGRAHGTRGAIDAWPLLEPATVREAPADFTAPGGWTIPSSTGGTTGVPLPLARSPRSVAFEQAALDHVLAEAGVRADRARVAVLRGDDIKSPDDPSPPFWQSALEGRRLVFSSNHLRRETVAAFAEALRAFDADYWWVYPTTLGALCRLSIEQKIDLRVPLIVSSSELLDDWTRETSMARFGARTLDYYGQAERVAFAWSDTPGIYRFLPGYAHVELIPADEDDGTTRYEIVGTGLWNEAMPLVRYRTGDLIRAPRPWSAEEREAIALGTRPFERVLGRDHEFLIGPDGAHLTGMDHLHRGVANVVRIQILHLRPDHVEIHVVPAPGYGAREREQILAQTRLKIPSTMTLDVREVEALEQTSLGKTPFIVRRPGVPVPA